MRAYFVPELVDTSDSTKMVAYVITTPYGGSYTFDTESGL